MDITRTDSYHTHGEFSKVSVKTSPACIPFVIYAFLPICANLQRHKVKIGNVGKIGHGGNVVEKGQVEQDAHRNMLCKDEVTIPPGSHFSLPIRNSSMSVHESVDARDITASAEHANDIRSN